MHVSAKGAAGTEAKKERGERKHGADNSVLEQKLVEQRLEDEENYQ